MPEIDALKFKYFGKSSFSSIIGTMYYIWPVHTGRSEAGLDIDANSDNDAENIFFLSNSEKSFNFFIDFLKVRFPDFPIVDKASAAIERELTGYLSNKTRVINLKPGYLCGTDFEKKIWETARKIPYGGVASYKELAGNAGYPNAFRAAGTALGNNPLMLVVPCHRVIRSNGEIGYFGGGEEIKLLLLDLEQPQQA